MIRAENSLEFLHTCLRSSWADGQFSHFRHCIGQIAHRSQRFGVLGAKNTLIGFEHSLLKITAPPSVSHIRQRFGHLGHGSKRLRMLSTENTLANLEHLLSELAGRREFSQLRLHNGQAMQRLKSQGILGSEHALLNLQRFLQKIASSLTSPVWPSDNARSAMAIVVSRWSAVRNLRHHSSVSSLSFRAASKEPASSNALASILIHTSVSPAPGGSTRRMIGRFGFVDVDRLPDSSLV